MSTELSNGVIIPEEYSDDWYDEMSINLRKLNDVITAASDNATDIQRLDTDKANQSDLTALTSRVSQNETDIIALQTAVSGALKREIVQSLPTQDISTTTIYMIRNSQSSGTNIYDEYMYINSQWELIGTSATDFSNYYTKNETDNLLSGKVDNSTLGSYYTKTESDNLLSVKANQTDLTALTSRVTQTETDITALQTAVSGALKREIVQTLPTEDISTTTIYMIRNSQSSGTNIYDEYMYINSQWELIGTSATDFSNYYTKNETDNLLSGKANNSDVVHKSGNETINGNKTFLNSPIIYNPDTSVNDYLVLKNPKATIGSTTDTGSQRITFQDKNGTVIGSLISSIDSNGWTYTVLEGSSLDSQSNVITRSVRLRVTNAGASLLPSNDNNLLLGSTSARWSNIYSVNYYYGSNNVEFSTKFVTTDTNQTISGAKTFSDTLTIYNNDSSQATKNLTISSSKIQVGDTSNSDSFGIVFNAGLSYVSRVIAFKDTSGTQNLQLAVRTKDSSNNLISSMIRLRLFANGLSTFESDGNNLVSLGSSSNKWKDVQAYQINSLEPSSLSLPSQTYVDISSYFTNTGTGDTNSYVASANGWIYLRLGDLSDCQATVYDSNNNRMWGQSTTGSVEQMTIPILKGQTLTTQWTTGSSVNVATARFIPCLGNI